MFFFFCYRTRALRRARTRVQTMQRRYHRRTITMARTEATRLYVEATHHWWRHWSSSIVNSIGARASQRLVTRRNFVGHLRKAEPVNTGTSVNSLMDTASYETWLVIRNIRQNCAVPSTRSVSAHTDRVATLFTTSRRLVYTIRRWAHS